MALESISRPESLAADAEAPEFIVNTSKNNKKVKQNERKNIMAYHRHDHYHHRYDKENYAADKTIIQCAYIGLGAGIIVGGIVWGIPGAVLGGIAGAAGGFVIGDIIVTFD